MEVHYNPEEALCDGEQSLSLDEFKNLMSELEALCDGEQSLSLDEFTNLMSELPKIAEAVGRQI